ncbi:hypothetical protein OGAPHI_006191 [Ogataea philodendri]|uniref:Uncharacterized protein n=1 Tax=Ogataea philodendri TaxID=1378263 RepID=A0A9P8NYC2_9ASCO|nr:uncharacterized protein OGAPHI_006191 [Ogataea philodendri]KAH3662010.1 hypothetical protein OGAPHI_006191 [Ogataea philodendri]
MVSKTVDSIPRNPTVRSLRHPSGKDQWTVSGRLARLEINGRLSSLLDSKLRGWPDLFSWTMVLDSLNTSRATKTAHIRDDTT